MNVQEPPGLSRRRWLGGLGALVVWPLGWAQTPSPRRQAHHLFGSHVEVLACQGSLSAADVDFAMDTTMEGLAFLNREWNAWKPGELGRLNAALARGHSQRVSSELLALIRLSLQLERRTEGLFNAGIGGLVGSWGFHDDVMRPGHQPTASSLAPWRRAAPSLEQLRIEGDRVASSSSRLQLDFGAIAKGVAIDRALDGLAVRGIRDAMVNLGGNLATRGRMVDRPWQIGIRDPFGPGLIAVVATRDHEAVVTSGNYERFRLLDGQRMGHVIDPRRGVPTPADGLVSVTVLHLSASFADAAATALLVAGPSGWLSLAHRLDLLHVLVVGADGRSATTPALAARLLSFGRRNQAHGPVAG